jgi:acyl-CoA thioesterase YciA
MTKNGQERTSLARLQLLENCRKLALDWPTNVPASSSRFFGPANRNFSMSEIEQLPKGEPLIRAIAMPADTNPYGDVLGGWLMGQMELAAANAAWRRCRGRCATVAVERMMFHRPVCVGDEVSLYAMVTHVGWSSMVVRVEAWRRSCTEEERNKVTEGTLTLVATDDNRKPRRVPAE